MSTGKLPLKVTGVAADNASVFAMRGRDGVAVARALAGLPDDYLVMATAGAWFVAGPTGVYVVVEAGDDAGAALEQARDVAAALRKRAAERLSWAPFIDVVLVDGGAGPVTVGDVLVVDRRHLAAAVLDGPPMADAGLPARLLALVTAGAPDAMIEACSASVPPRAARSRSTTSAGEAPSSCSPTRPASTGTSGRHSPAA